MERSRQLKIFEANYKNNNFDIFKSQKIQKHLCDKERDNKGKVR